MVDSILDPEPISQPTNTALCSFCDCAMDGEVDDNEGILPTINRHQMKQDEVDEFLSTRPWTKVMQSKTNVAKKTGIKTKYEYRVCRCGCGYRMSITFSGRVDCVIVKESDIPEDHEDVEENDRNVRISSDLKSLVIKLLEDNRFNRSFGPVAVVDRLRARGLSRDEIPTNKQLQNLLYNLRRYHFSYVNEISPVEEAIRQYVYTGDEADEQPFIYYYPEDSNGRLVLNDGSDRFPFYLSFSSKAMLSVLSIAATSPHPLVLHMDSTFKCNFNEFPLLVLGVTDAQQQFHVLSVTIMSHLTEDLHVKILEAFK